MEKLKMEREPPTSQLQEPIKRGMSWVSQQGALCGAGGNLVFVSGMLAQGQISTFISMTHNVLLIKHLCPS